MAGTRMGIQKYQRIRRFIPYIYLYGFLSRDDFTKFDIGADEYDQCTKLLRDVLPELSNIPLWKKKRKYLNFPREYGQSYESQLANTYLLHTIKPEEMTDYLLILSRLAQGEASLKTLTAYVECQCKDETKDKYMVIRSRVMELLDNGYLIQTGRKYRLKPDPLKQLSDETLSRLYRYICFSCEMTYPRVPGSYLKRTVGRELRRRKIPLSKGGFPFLFKRNGYHNVFDEDMVYQLRQQIPRHSWIKTEFRDITKEILPLELRYESQLGRWYLIYWEERPRIARVSNILSFKPCGAEPDDSWAQKNSTAKSRFEFSAVSDNVPPQGRPYLVEAQLDFGENTRLRQIFCRDIPQGKIEGDRYITYINDPIELKPFLRQYAPWVHVLPGDHGLDEIIRADLLELRRQLEVNPE